MTKENEEDIKVNRRSTDKVYFESPFVQSVYDSIDFLRDETKNILRDLDSNEFKQSIDEFDMEDFGEKTADHFSDIFDDLSQIRSKIINSDDLPEFVRDYSKNAKMALNRDEIYVRKAERKLNRINSDDELVHQYKVNISKLTKDETEGVLDKFRIVLPRLKKEIINQIKNQISRGDFSMKRFLHTDSHSKTKADSYSALQQLARAGQSFGLKMEKP